MKVAGATVDQASTAIFYVVECRNASAPISGIWTVLGRVGFREYNGAKGAKQYRDEQAALHPDKVYLLHPIPLMEIPNVAVRPPEPLTHDDG